MSYRVVSGAPTKRPDILKMVPKKSLKNLGPFCRTTLNKNLYQSKQRGKTKIIQKLTKKALEILDPCARAGGQWFSVLFTFLGS